MLEPDWVAEEPEAHLLPHIERLCAERGWKVSRSDVVDAVLEVDVEHRPSTVATPREAAFAILGTFAEASTHVVERSPDVGRSVGSMRRPGCSRATAHSRRTATRAAIRVRCWT